jgi:hypothetical protein
MADYRISDLVFIQDRRWRERLHEFSSAMYRAENKRKKKTMNENEVYLGDAVYASFDGYQIWLRTRDGGNQRIALDPTVLTAFDQYRAELKRNLSPQL